ALDQPHGPASPGHRALAAGVRVSAEARVRRLGLAAQRISGLALLARPHRRRAARADAGRSEVPALGDRPSRPARRRFAGPATVASLNLASPRPWATCRDCNLCQIWVDTLS